MALGTWYEIRNGSLHSKIERGALVPWMWQVTLPSLGCLNYFDWGDSWEMGARFREIDIQSLVQNGQQSDLSETIAIDSGGTE